MEGIKLVKMWRFKNGFDYLQKKNRYLMDFIWTQSLSLQIQSVPFLVWFHYRSVLFVFFYSLEAALEIIIH